MKKIENNFAFIDGQNLNLGIQELGWKLDFSRFRHYLKEKYAVKTAYYFIGYVSGNQDLYSYLQKAGYVLIFKPTIPDNNGKIKGKPDPQIYQLDQPLRKTFMRLLLQVVEKFYLQMDIVGDLVKINLMII